MAITGKGIRTPDDSVKISALAAAMRTAFADVDTLLTQVNPFAGTELALDADANTMRTTGWFYIRYTANAANILNFPFKNLMHFHVWSTSNGFTYQMAIGYSADFEVYIRSTGSVSSGTWAAWEPVLKRDVIGAAARREMLVAAFRDRRGGVIGTSGRPPVALRFDHGLAKFGTIVLPLLRKYSLPWSQAVNSGTIGNAANASSYAQLQGWALNDGGEVWNHGRDHTGATGYTPITDQILKGLNALVAGMPALAIEGWAPPGVAAPDFDGYAPMATPEQHAGTYAGRLILAHHAAVAGYVPGLYRPMPATLPIGMGHTTIDEQTPTWVDGVLRGAIAAGAGLQIMLHPDLIDTASGMTTANLETVLANIAARRDAGELEVLSPSGLLLADPTTTRRHNMIVNGNFTDGLNSWANTASWSIAAGNGFSYATTTAGTPMTQSIGFSRNESLLGGMRELVYKVRATTGAVVRTNIIGTAVNASKDHTLPASANWVEVRRPVTVPLNLLDNLTAHVGRVSGGRVDVANVRLQSI